jgi:hypothetical protein
MLYIQFNIDLDILQERRRVVQARGGEFEKGFIIVRHVHIYKVS